MIRVKNLHKSFGSNEVLKGIDFEVDNGEVIAVLGSSGSGKTTMLRCMSFLEKADQGEITFDEFHHDMVTISRRDIHKMRMHMGFVFQSFNLFANQTALENVTTGLTVARKIPKPQAQETAHEMLKKVGMEDRALYYPAQLSGGQQQRVAIARAIAANPRVVFFDEPTSALDPELTGEILRVIRKLAEKKMTMVIVTHEMAFARDVSDWVVFMNGGVIVEQGDPREVIDHPTHERTIQFLRRLQES